MSFLRSHYWRSRYGRKKGWRSRRRGRRRKRSRRRKRRNSRTARNTALTTKTKVARRSRMKKRAAAAPVAAAAAAMRMTRRRRKLSERSHRTLIPTWMKRMPCWIVCPRTRPRCWTLPVLLKGFCCCWCSNNIWRICTASQTGMETPQSSLVPGVHAAKRVQLTLFVCLCFSKIQKYSPTESAKVYDKTVNRKSKVHFNPHQTLNYVKNGLVNKDLSYETKRNIVKQYLDVSTLSLLHSFIYVTASWQPVQSIHEWICCVDHVMKESIALFAKPTDAVSLSVQGTYDAPGSRRRGWARWSQCQR